MSHCTIAAGDVWYRTTFASCDLVQKVSTSNTVKYQMSLSVTENKQGSLVHHFTQLPKHEDFANHENVTEMGSLVELNVDSMSMKREIFGVGITFQFTDYKYQFVGVL